jgi:benzoate 4-monooxygenase
VSIAHPDALKVIYGHGTGALKSYYYDATSSTRSSTFSARNPAEHSRKRKIVSDIFSLKSVLEYEPNFRLHTEGLVVRWDKLAEDGKKGLSGEEGNGWYGRDGRVWCDALSCESTWVWQRESDLTSLSTGYNYLTLDTISDLAFGSPFGMLKNASDVLPLVKSRSDGSVTYGSESAKGDVEYFPIVKVIRERGLYVGSLGDLPRWVWPILKKIHPWYRTGDTAAANLAKLAITVVHQRLETPTDRPDVLGKLVQGKDHHGKAMDPPELAGEAAAYISAATGTTSR